MYLQINLQFFKFIKTDLKCLYSSIAKINLLNKMNNFINKKNYNTK